MRLIRPTTLFLMTLTVLMGWSRVAATESFEQKTFRWKSWKSIKAAIVLRALDGPEDILEKAEIIEDRIDLLNNEKSKLTRGIKEGRQRLKNLENQREILKDLAEIRQGADFQNQRRLHTITEQIQQETHRLKRRTASLKGLRQEMARLKRLLFKYKKKARLLRLKESNVQ